MRRNKIGIIGERLKFARKEKGLVIKELTKLTGATESSISCLETGKSTNLNAATLLFLAKELGVSMDWLAGLSDNVAIQGTESGPLVLRELIDACKELTEKEIRILTGFAKVLKETGR